MAIDSAVKRSSAINPRSPWRGILPIPDGSSSATERATVVYLYGGLAEAGGSDTTPDQFDGETKAGQALSATVTFADVTPVGYDSAADISVSNGSYRINAGSYTTSPGTLSPGDSFTARNTSSASYLTNVDTVVTVGGVSATYRSTTEGDPANSAYLDAPFSLNWWSEP